MRTGRRQQPKTDILAISVSVCIAVLGVVAQFIISAISYGQLLEKVGDLQRRITVNEAAQIATNAAVSEQKAQIAGMAAKLDSIKAVSDRIDGKLDNRSGR